MLNTNLCKLLDIKYPVIQGGMAWVSDAVLAAAVSNAGGLGIISAMNTDKDMLKREIGMLKKICDRPFGVNIMLMSPHAADVAKVVVEENVPVVTTGAGNPAKYMADWKNAGITVIPVVPSTAYARLMERAGAAAVIAEGGEAGGHVGEISTMPLIPQVCDAVNIPVIAAGGIADGRGLAAALMLGACGVQCGTAFLTAKECTIHSNYKERVIAAKDIDTILTGRRLGHPVRSLKTPFSREFAAKEQDVNVTAKELESFGAGALRMAAKEGDMQKGCFMAGQSAGLIKREMPASEIIETMVFEAEKLLRDGSKWAR